MSPSKTPSAVLLLSLIFFGCLSSFIEQSSANWGLIGSFDPGRGADPDRTTALGQWSGKNQALQLVFTTFDWQENNWLWTSLNTIWSKGTVSIISWEPWFLQAQGTPSNIEVLVANGQYDNYIKEWAGNLKNFLAGADGKLNTADDRRAYIRFAHEMNGNWYPWSAKSGETSPSDYVRMWKRVVDTVTNAGVDRKHIQWIWSGICIDVGDFKIEQYWPGSEYVDWVGLGGMNWGTSEGWARWNMPTDLFAQMIPRVRGLSGNTKPFAITEYCSVTNGGGVEGKNTWLTTLFDFAIANQARGLVYFNMDKNEGDNGGMKDWGIFGGVNGDETYYYNGRTFKGFSAYRKSANNKYWLAGTVSQSIIDDKFFFGTGTCSSNNDCLSGYSCSNGNCVTGSGKPDTPTPAPTKKPDSNAPLVVFSDTVSPQVWSWGSSGLTFKYNSADSSAPEGSKSVSAKTTGWGGFGIFYEPNFQDFSKYSKIKFSMKSTNQVKIELQDSNGAKAPYYAPSTGGAWKSVEVALSTFSSAGVNLASINGPFVSTMEATGSYSVDNIQFL